MATSRAYLTLAAVASLALLTLATSSRTEAGQSAPAEPAGPGGWTQLAPSQSFIAQDKDYVIILNSNHDTLTFVDKSVPHEVQRVSLRAK